MPCKRVTPLVGKNWVRNTWMLGALVVLAGCSTNEHGKNTAPAAAPAAAMMDGRCHAEQAQFTVGKQATPALLEQAKKLSGSQTVRALKPSDMVTMDYRSERLNLNTDASGLVLRANCG